MVETRTKGVFGPSGYDLVPRPWSPGDVTEADRQEAVQALAALERSMAPAARESKERWLATLGTLVAGQMSAEEARLRLVAFKGVWEVPGCLLTKATLRHAAERFKWFPSYAELSAFFAEVERPIRTRENRLRIIAFGSNRPSAVARALAEARRREGDHA